ncbi:response regulator [Dehalococcoidia bacterium]|nr:response regulator [Dehalococcoidia bacterium]
MRILILDDEIDVCKDIQRELRREGGEVEYTTSPTSVLTRLHSSKRAGEPYEVLLLNLDMPEVSGFELLREIGEAGLDLDVIVITRDGNGDKEMEAIRLGAIDYLRKPISMEELRTALFRVRQKQAAEGKKALKHRVLVVDDERDLAARIKQELEREGHEVAVAYDGLEGLEYFKNNHVDAVIADIRMPGIDGLEMLDECRAINPDFVPIIITGFGDHEKAIRSLKLGVFEYLRKPISVEELISVVTKGVDLIALRRGLPARQRELEIESALKTRYAQRLEREKRFSTDIIATIPESLLVVDEDLRIKSANRTFCETFRKEIDPEKVVGTRLSDILGDPDGRLTNELIKLFGTDDMLKDFELPYRSKQLGERIFNITARGMVGAAGEEKEEPEQLIVIEDITERKDLEEQLKDTVEKLKASQEELSTPVVQIWDRVLALPLIGVVDSLRAQKIVETLLNKIVETQSEMVILDITGVSSIDTQVVNHLIKTVQAARLLGAECVITGIKPKVAQTMIQLGLDMESFPTRRSLRDGLMYALEKIENRK